MNLIFLELIILSTLCTLRHVTARHDLENEARESIRKSYGIGNIVKLLRDKNIKENWGIVKATVGLMKNLSVSAPIVSQICEQNGVRRLTELLIVVERERTKLFDETNNYLQRFDSLIELIICALKNLLQHPTSKSIMKEMNSIPIFIRYSQLPNSSLQQTSTAFLKELNVDSSSFGLRR